MEFGIPKLPNYRAFFSGFADLKITAELSTGLMPTLEVLKLELLEETQKSCTFSSLMFTLGCGKQFLRHLIATSHNKRERLKTFCFVT